MSRDAINAHSFGTAKYLAHSFFLLTALLFTCDAMATQAGRILFAHGEVSLAGKGSEPRNAKRGDVIEVGDTVSTGNASSAQLRFTDGSLVALSADSVFVIEKHTYNKDEPEKNEQAAELLRGGLRAITGAIGHERPEAVNYRTPVATIGIRGTVYQTIYVPEGGLPGLPGVEPGQYTLLLRGSVVLSTKAGELTLGMGEIGYIADEESPPVLRPDLTAIFVQASQAGIDIKEHDDGVPEPPQDDSQTIDTGDDSVANELSSLATPSVRNGPYAMVATSDGAGAKYQGTFMTTEVSLASNGALLSASNGSGDINSFTFTGTGPSVTGGTTAGDSQIYWGMYADKEVSMTDSSGPITLTSAPNVYYIDADNVLLSTTNLPTTGNFTYYYAGGSSGVVIDPSSNLVVDFANSTIDITLIDITYPLYPATWSGSDNISAFYSTNGVSLTSPDGFTPSNIQGSFVGTNAEGAITTFHLNYSDFYEMGTAAFKR